MKHSEPQSQIPLSPSQQKEQWVDEVMTSLQGIQQATPSDQVLTRLMAQLDDSADEQTTSFNPLTLEASNQQIRWLAAVAMLVIIVNVGVGGISRMDTNVGVANQSIHASNMDINTVTNITHTTMVDLEVDSDIQLITQYSLY